MTFQSLSSYVDDAANIAGNSNNDECNMTTEANVMKQFSSASKEAAANVTFDLDVTKIQMGDTIS